MRLRLSRNRYDSPFTWTMLAWWVRRSTSAPAIVRASSLMSVTRVPRLVAVRHDGFVFAFFKHTRARAIVDLQTARWSPAQIARELNRRGLYAPSGAPWTDEKIQSFVDRHVFYNGKYIGTELLTYVSEDFARPRPMTDSERAQFLQKIFEVAGW